MRPRELTLQGFRSYRDRTTFDFRGRRLVGIVGPIGAGKSSILDAIAFALYGKTPAVGGATRSLIHQHSDSAHVELVFQVEGQTWRVQRALRARGAGQHKLERLADDEPDAVVLETVVQERPTQERVETLLGLSFDGFCRSVLLAQNRFAQFLMATPTQRNEVLKGVFGYERFDAALQLTRERVIATDAELSGLAQQREQIHRAKEQLGEAREAAARAAERDQELAAARPSLEALVATIDRAAAAAEAVAPRIELLQTIARDLPRAEILKDVVTAAADAGEAAAAAEAEVAAAEGTRATAIAERDALAERLGDPSDLRAFAVLVERFDAEAAVVRAATDAVTRCEAAHAAAGNGAEAADAAAAAAITWADEAGAVAEAAETTLAGAEAALHDARHANMAHELRRSLTAGDPCPVCGQHVATVPALGRAVGVTKAERAYEKAREAAAAARREAESARADAAAATERARAAGDAVARTREEHEMSVEVLRQAEAVLAVTRSSIVDGLGEGDPRVALAEREGELQAADAAVRGATQTLEAVRAAKDALLRQQAEASEAIADLAARLTGAWGRLGERRTVERSPQAVQHAYVEIGEAVIAQIAEADATRSAMEADAAAARAGLREGFEALALPADVDLTAALAQAQAVRAAADERVRGIEERVEAAANLDARVTAAEERRDLAKRLASDLQPSRFLAFLLEEERAALAELGSHHFEELTDGGYRFSEDDTFSIVDMNAASQVRKADSLSGGETFLASLALALALAEMVARGGGRLDAFFLDEGFGSLDPEHLDRAMDGIARLVAEDDQRLVVLVSHVEQMKQTMEDLIVLDKDDRTGDTLVVSGARPGI